ncbi:MAG: heme ABC exporter ATP-binding protein CcmA [Acidimicrobiia bacterium]|nr:MAG: heme ABC exporter ATP-binding protein CcmA [Acidimicrobiia bacterium]
MSSVIELRDVGVDAGSTSILRGVDLQVGRGEILGLFGANGAGKTTLLRLVATLLRPSAGVGSVLGIELTSDQRYAIRRRIGMIGHVPGLYPELTLGENLDFAARVAGVSRDEVGGALAAVGLGGAIDREAGISSFGMQRRAEFARELMIDRDLLLLDEPHSALDQDAVELVNALVRKVAAGGGAVILVSHDRQRVARIADRTVELTEGTLQ